MKKIILRKNDALFYQEAALKSGLSEELLDKVLLNTSLIISVFASIASFNPKGQLAFLLLCLYLGYNYLNKISNWQEPEVKLTDIKNVIVNDFKKSYSETKDNFKKIITKKDGENAKKQHKKS